MSDSKEVSEEVKSAWKAVELLISVTKTAKFSEGEDWEWKKPFQELKLSTIRVEDKWQIALVVGEGELDTVYSMCDGRHKVETILEFIPEKEEETK